MMKNVQQREQQERMQIQNNLFYDFCEMQAIDARESLDQVRRRLNPCLDDLQCVILYQQLAKYGTGIAKELHQKYSPNTRYDIFLSRILDASKYISNNGVRFNKILTLSVEKQDQINQITLAKTMKSMFCSVCLLYDCQMHKFPDHVVIENKFDFISPKNIVPVSKKVENAIKLCLAYNYIHKDNKKEQQSSQNNRQRTLNYQDMFQEQQVEKFFQIQKKDQPCCLLCYVNLKYSQYQKLRRQTGYKCSSPLARAILNIGIKIFNYDPCKIAKLFFSSTIGVACNLIFVYLFEDYHLLDRLQHKFYENQVEELRQFEKQQQDNAPNPVPPIRKKKKKVQETNYNIFNEAGLEQPMCYHYFLQKQPEDIFCSNCTCTLRGFCTQQCLCSPNCPLRRKGCECKGKQDCKSNKCICCSQRLECQPGLCLNCFPSPNKTVAKRNSCKNDEIIRGKMKIVRIGRSNIPMAGLGCFAGEPIQQNQLVKLYQGQVISYDVQNFREKIKLDDTLYNFQLIENGQSIDSRFIGNKSRFINHGNDGSNNLVARHVFSKGILNMGLYSQRDIEKNQQLFFNYDGNGQLYAKHRKKYPFIKKAKNSK